MTYPIRSSGEAATNQMYIEEKNATSGVLFDSTNIKTIGDIKAIVAKALNTIGEISILLSDIKIPHEIELSAFNEETLKRITYSVTNSERSDPMTTYFSSWSAFKTPEGSSEVKYRMNIEGTVSANIQPQVAANTLPQIAANILPQIAANIRPQRANFSNPQHILCVSTTTTTTEPTATTPPNNTLNSPTLPTAIKVIPSALNLQELEPKHILETYITSQARLHKIDGIANHYITTIGVASFMKYSNGEIIMPRGTWSIYTLKGDTYNFIGLFNRPNGYTYGDVAIGLGSNFRVRVGKISKVTDLIQGNLPKAPELHGKYQILNFPMPGKFVALFDRVVVQYNESEKVWLKI